MTNPKRAILLRGKEKSLSRKHPWIFSGALKSKDKDIEEQYILATNGLIKPTDFLRYLLFKIKISTKKTITIKTLQKSI